MYIATTDGETLCSPCFLIGKLIYIWTRPHLCKLLKEYNTVMQKPNMISGWTILLVYMFVSTNIRNIETQCGGQEKHSIFDQSPVL